MVATIYFTAAVAILATGGALLVRTLVRRHQRRAQVYYLTHTLRDAIFESLSSPVEKPTAELRVKPLVVRPAAMLPAPTMFSNLVPASA